LKKTYEGRIGYAQGIPAVFIDGRDWYFPDFDFRGNIRIGQTVRVSIEVEPVTLKDRVAKIFDAIRINDLEPSALINFDTRDFQALRARVLAELDKP
jgi:hypothetical protein